MEFAFLRQTWPKTCRPRAPSPTWQMSELNALLYSLCSVCRFPSLNKALFLCKPSHPTDTPGLACALRLPEAPVQTLPVLLLWPSSPLRASQPGSQRQSRCQGRFAMQKAAVGEETFSRLGSGTAVQRRRAVLQPSKARGIRAGSCNRSVDLSRRGTAQAALPAGWPPLPLLAPFSFTCGSLLAP